MTDFDAIFGVAAVSHPLFQTDSAFRREDGLYAVTALSERPAPKGVPVPRPAAGAEPSRKRKALSSAGHRDTKLVEEKTKRPKKDAQRHAAASATGKKSKPALRQVDLTPHTHTSATATGNPRAAPAHWPKQQHGQSVSASPVLEEGRGPAAVDGTGDGTLPADGGEQEASQPAQTARQVFIG